MKDRGESALAIGLLFLVLLKIEEMEPLKATITALFGAGWFILAIVRFCKE